MNHWSSLDPRVLAAWSEFAAMPAADSDRSAFLERLYRGNFRHAYPPTFVSAAAADEITDIGGRLTRLIIDMPRRVFGDDVAAWMAYLGVPDEDAALMRSALANARSRRAAAWFIRPDLLVTEAGLKLVELNVSTPMGGMSTLPAYTAAIRDSAFGRFLERRGLPVRGTDMVSVWLDAFARLVDRPGENGLHVFEAVANPADTDTGRRFFVDMVRSGGYDISCGLISELELSDSAVSFQGRKVDIIFTMYTWHETKRFVPPELTSRLIELDGAGVVTYIGSPATALYDNKANLELLGAPEFDHHLDEKERALARAHIPATFRLERSTVDRAAALRDRLVCKPRSAYGGINVAFGAAMGSDAWRDLLDERLADPLESYVCQEMVPVAPVDLAERDAHGNEVVLGSMVFGGLDAGIFMRQRKPNGLTPINVKNGAEASAVLTVAE